MAALLKGFKVLKTSTVWRPIVYWIKLIFFFFFFFTKFPRFVIPESRDWEFLNPEIHKTVPGLQSLVERFGSTYLLATIWRQIKREDCEKRYPHTRNYDVNRVKQRFPSHCYIKGDVQIRFITASVKLFVSETRKNNLNYIYMCNDKNSIAILFIKFWFFFFFFFFFFFKMTKKEKETRFRHVLYFEKLE